MTPVIYSKKNRAKTALLASVLTSHLKAKNESKQRDRKSKKDSKKISNVLNFKAELKTSKLIYFFFLLGPTTPFLISMRVTKILKIRRLI